MRRNEIWDGSGRTASFIRPSRVACKIRKCQSYLHAVTTYVVAHNGKACTDSTRPHKRLPLANQGAWTQNQSRSRRYCSSAIRAASLKISTNIGRVSLPVCVFWLDG